jgi:hypothetical protein
MSGYPIMGYLPNSVFRAWEDVYDPALCPDSTVGTTEFLKKISDHMAGGQIEIACNANA